MREQLPAPTGSGPAEPLAYVRACHTEASCSRLSLAALGLAQGRDPHSVQLTKSSCLPTLDHTLATPIFPLPGAFQSPFHTHSPQISHPACQLCLECFWNHPVPHPPIPISLVADHCSSCLPGTPPPVLLCAVAAKGHVSRQFCMWHSSAIKSRLFTGVPKAPPVWRLPTSLVPWLPQSSWCLPDTRGCLLPPCALCPPPGGR